MGLSSAVGHRSPNSLCHADGCNAWGPIGGPQGDNVCIPPSVSLGRLSGKCPHAFPELIAWENGDLKLCASCACTALYRYEHLRTNCRLYMFYVRILVPYKCRSLSLLSVISDRWKSIRFITSVLLEIGVFQYNIYIYIYTLHTAYV